MVANLSYLAKCISIMPTSGYQFTAQAPLFPVFLLGMLATVADHADIAQKWFDSVTSAPVRSVRIPFPTHTYTHTTHRLLHKLLTRASYRAYLHYMKR